MARPAFSSRHRWPPEPRRLRAQHDFIGHPAVPARRATTLASFDTISARNRGGDSTGLGDQHGGGFGKPELAGAIRLPGGPLSLPATGRSGITRLRPDATAITFTNALAAGRSLTNHVLLNGSGVALGDVDEDGWPDLYVCSDMASVDRLWMNLGNGRFRSARRESLRKTSRFSMGIDFGDLNRDGLDDSFVTRTFREN